MSTSHAAGCAAVRDKALTRLCKLEWATSSLHSLSSWVTLVVCGAARGSSARVSGSTAGVARTARELCSLLLSKLLNAKA